MATRARKLHRRRALAAAAVVAALVGTAAFWLADTGTTNANVGPVAGLGAGGQAVTFNGLAETFTRPQGNASITAGIALARLDVAVGFANRFRLEASWINVADAERVLGNPNAQIYIALYRPLYEGTCFSGEANSLAATHATFTDTSLPGTEKTHCAVLDTAATGAVVTDGKLFLSRNQIGGYLLPQASDASVVSCAGQTASNTNWCRPAGYDADQVPLFVGATIVTPGGKPAGQQNDLNELEFYFGTKQQ